MAWAEDRVVRGRNPSADPGAKTGGRAARPRVDRPSFPFPSGIGIKAINPSGRSPEHWGGQKIVNTGRRSPGSI
jgi:hypothetical protein